MFSPDDYQLLDFGDGRRLERFGSIVLDRPCPAAEGLARVSPAAWDQADARFERTEGDEGRWIDRRPIAERWTVAHGAVQFELKRTEFGHVGLFPEQVANWDWIAQQLADAPRLVRVLNLFAYTGGSTLAVAAAGAEVTHVDAARNVVAWGRRNAELSGLAAAPIRWIAEDAAKYVGREWKRGSLYDAVILDPPSYGHGPRGEPWQIERNLPPLLELCGRLTAGRRRFVLLTCHTPQLGTDRLREMLADAMGGADRGDVYADPLTIRSVGGRQLPSGVVVRWSKSGKASKVD